MLGARLTLPPGSAHKRRLRTDQRTSGRSSGVEHNLAKVGVEGSNPFARSSSKDTNQSSAKLEPCAVR